MKKNLVNFRCFLAALLLTGTALSAFAEEFADDLWIVEPKAGDNLKNVMQEMADGTNSQAAAKPKASFVKETGLESAAVAEEIKTDALLNTDKDFSSEDVLDKVRKVAVSASSEAQKASKPHQSVAVPSANQPQSSDDALSSELVGPKQILHDKIHHQRYIVQSVETSANRQFEEKNPPVQLIEVPHEAQAKRVLYDDVDMTVHADTPRSFDYPIGDERRLRDENLRAHFDPFQRMTQQNVDEYPEHTEAVAHYKQEILNCTRVRSEKTTLETELLGYDGKVYDTAAYLSNTLTETEICLSELGYEIVDKMYFNEAQVLKDYEEHLSTLHVDSTSVDFNPKFCGETCTLKNVVDAQRTRIAEFQKYLCQLLNESPKELQREPDMLEPDDLADIPFMGEDDVDYEPLFQPITPDELQERQKPRVISREYVDIDGLNVRRHSQPARANAPVRPRVVRSRQQAEPALRPIQVQPRSHAEPVAQTKPADPEPVPYFEGMEVPMIDESEL